MSDSILNTMTSDLSATAPVVNNKADLGPNKWVVAGVAATAALAVAVTDQVKNDRFDLVSNIATGTATLVGAGIAYKVASDVTGVPTSLCSVMGGSIGLLSAVIVQPVVSIAGNKVAGTFFAKEEMTEYDPVTIFEEAEEQAA